MSVAAADTTRTSSHQHQFSIDNHCNQYTPMGNHHKRIESKSNNIGSGGISSSSSDVLSSSISQKGSMSQQQQSSNPWNIPGKEWRDMDARSAPFQTGNNKDLSARNTSNSSPPKTAGEAGYTPVLAAPRAVPSYPRFTSPQPGDNLDRSPSPTKKASSNPTVTTNTNTSSSSSATSPFSFAGGVSSAATGMGSSGGAGQGDVRERWASLGQAQQTFSSQQQQQSLQQQSISPTHQSSDSTSARKMIPPGPFPNEAFLGYNDIWSNGGAAGQNRNVAQSSLNNEQQSGQSQRSYTMPTSQPPDLEQLNTRFDPSNIHYGRDEGPFSATNHGAQFRGGSTDAAFSGNSISAGIPSSGSLSPRSIMHYHQQQMQAQQAMAMQAAQQHGTTSNQINQSLVGNSNTNEEITTVFIVGFPDDMSEREFANMFLFAKGFEASTLKIPNGSITSSGPGQRLNEVTGAGGPYSAVSMPNSAMFDQNGPPGGWDEHSLSLALSRAGTGDAFPPLGSTGAGPSMGGSVGNASGTGPGGKIKQIIGFAKFRTRSEALEARDALNGRKIDTERGCVLKTEMAKKNLHTKQRPVLSSSSNAAEGGITLQGPSSAPLSGGVVGASQYGAMPQQLHNVSAMDRDATFVPRQQQRSDMGPPLQPQAFPSLNSAPFNNQNNGNLMSPTSETTYGRGPDFFPRNRLAQESQNQAQSQIDPHRGSSGGDKWAPLGPLDYYDNSQQRSQQQGQQSQQSGVKQSAALGIAPPRGPDWSALGSPPGLYASAAARGTENSSKTSGAISNSNPLSAFGDQQISSSGGHAHKQSQSQSQPQLASIPQQQDQREDFGKGESTASRGETTATMINKNNNNDGSNNTDDATFPPIQASTANGVGKNSNGIINNNDNINSNINSNEATGRPQSRVSQRSRQTSRTTSPVNAASSTSTFVQRFGPLRIDSPNIHQYPRTFSPNPKSPSGENQANLVKSASSTTTTTNATSPTSPFLDYAHNLPSPSSRSFSIDANPPGNTLFVGNLPGSIVTPPATIQLEEALRKLFSQKNGFRQMSFRVKSSGPMCFVEFEDVGCAGRALGEANGETLDGVVKGGLRLSFSKNPLFKSTLSDGHSNNNNSNGAMMQQRQNQRQSHPHSLDLNQLSTLEETAFEQGYSEGQEHGKLHGLFEGRQLGLLKGFEVWEEIGYMEGVARFHLNLIPLQSNRKELKQRQQLEALLEIIATLPMQNDETVNLFETLEKLRARFKMITTSLGISLAPLPGGNGQDINTPRLVQIHGKAVDPDQLNF